MSACNTGSIKGSNHDDVSYSSFTKTCKPVAHPNNASGNC